MRNQNRKLCVTCNKLIPKSRILQFKKKEILTCSKKCANSRRRDNYTNTKV